MLTPRRAGAHRWMRGGRKALTEVHETKGNYGCWHCAASVRQLWWVKTITPSRGFFLWRLSEHSSREFNDNVVQRRKAVTQNCSFKT